MKKVFKMLALGLLAGGMMMFTACGDPNGEGEDDPVDQPGDPILLEEGFENGAPTDWSYVDADGDGLGWGTLAALLGQACGQNGSNDCLFSQSYDNQTGVLYPDNFVITKSVKIPNGHYSLSWGIAAQDPNYPAENYTVYVGTNDNGTFNSIAQLHTEVVTAKAGTWRTRTVDLKDYAGQTVCFAFRHHDCSDNYFLLLDNVKVFDNTL